VAAAAAVALFALPACGGEERTTRPEAPRPGLEPGLTEYDPATLSGPLVAALRPRYVRVYVLWSAAQPRPGAAPDWDEPGTGDSSPRAQLRAIAAARRRAPGRFEPVATFFSTPAWAARPPGGCEPPRPNVNARAPRPDALDDYRATVASFLATARAEGVPVRLLSAWNEPNSGLFLAPQRQRCHPRASSRAAALYAPLARAMRAALDAAPGHQEMLVGEASSPSAARPIVSTVSELVEALPRDVACAGRVWAQHQYAGDADGVAEAQRALRAIRCAPRELWVTETGVSPPRPGAPAASPAAGCRALEALLARWWRDPAVTAAFQYTLREDPRFPVGLATPDGRSLRPAYALWAAWGRRERASDPPPGRGACDRARAS
jgi:hypothetical protein